MRQSRGRDKPGLSSRVNWKLKERRRSAELKSTQQGYDVKCPSFYTKLLSEEQTFSILHFNKFLYINYKLQRCSFSFCTKQPGQKVVDKFILSRSWVKGPNLGFSWPKAKHTQGTQEKGSQILSAHLCAWKETQMAEKWIPEEAYSEMHSSVWRGGGLKNRSSEGPFHGRMEP